ncbi:thioredoxin family protein [Stieleria sp. TO1_6]|uniref:thioredoxin family protein n=1 Tax=Stieleria tagensis TaxID=2956795 RepID=UPI00209B4C4A|nr:thioredoxin family protein [Stieleria tagensis]MCO8121478.1 thioredoxin family protein [Stieleria tagensis]
MSLDYAALFDQGQAYETFLTNYASESQRLRWAAVHGQVQLSEQQRTLLEGFQRQMKVLVSAGAWCGDCINQCPIFDFFAAANEKIQVRFFDRDDHSEFADAVSTCGGHRVPSVLFLSEDNFVCGRYGDRTLATYRHMAETQLGPSCPTGIGAVNVDLLAAVTQQWLDEFERIQLMLRLSGRLREKHGD